MKKFCRGIGSIPCYRIVKALFSDPKTVGELIEKTKLFQPFISRHLLILKETGLVKDERQGQKVLYAFNVKHTIQLLKHLFRDLYPRKNQKHKCRLLITFNL